jgi:predicted  nucleic acid-binding Zn-ribbon protein
MAIPLFVRSTVLAIVAVAAGANPVAKVITLLEDLKKEVEADGKSEATSYGEFACFCKDTTTDKATSIKDTEDKIQSLSGDIAKDTAQKKEKETEVVERKAKHKKIGEELTTEHSRCLAAQADFEYAQADIAKALDSLERAIKAMEAKKADIGLSTKKAKVAAKSFIELEQDVKRALALAGIDPSDPAYKYHSKEINEILAKLKKDFADEKSEGEEKWETQKTACQEKKDGLDKQMKDNLEAISKAEEKVEELAKKIADDRESLVQAQKDLEQDSAYLKDLTTQCEDKAHVWDQRSAMRNSEIEAIEEALKILENDAKENAAEVLTLAQNKVKQSKAKLAIAKPVSFLQTAPAKAVTNFLAKQGVSAADQARQEKVVDILRTAGTRLGSTDLYLLAMKVNVDHYKEVKAMIQKLIERLLDEEKLRHQRKVFVTLRLERRKMIATTLRLRQTA